MALPHRDRPQASAKDAAREPAKKGLVFLDYDQTALDRAYDQRVRAPNGMDVTKRYASDRAAVRVAWRSTGRRAPPEASVTVGDGGGPGPRRALQGQ